MPCMEARRVDLQDATRTVRPSAEGLLLPAIGRPGDAILRRHESVCLLGLLRRVQRGMRVLASVLAELQRDRGKSAMAPGTAETAPPATRGQAAAPARTRNYRPMCSDTRSPRAVSTQSALPFGENHSPTPRSNGNRAFPMTRPLAASM